MLTLFFVKSPAQEVEFAGEIIKSVTPTHGVIFGWACLSKLNGIDYEDMQNDVIDDACIEQMAIDFCKADLPLGVEHKNQGGQILAVWPLTDDICKAYGITAEKRGLMLMVKPDDATLKRYQNGEFMGFSIAGSVIDSEPEDADG